MAHVYTILNAVNQTYFLRLDIGEQKSNNQHRSLMYTCEMQKLSIYKTISFSQVIFLPQINLVIY